VRKRTLVLEKIEVENFNKQRNASIYLRSHDLEQKQHMDKENFKKKIQLELEIFEKEKLRNFEEYI